jgi:hypothetical protein
MKKLLILVSILALTLTFTGNAVLAHDNDDDDHDRDHNYGNCSYGGERSDFALFDGTNPANLDTKGRTGVVCGVTKMTHKKQKAIAPGKSFTYHIVVTNDGSGPLECKVIYTDQDFIRYKIPLGTSFSLSQAAGSGENDAAVRLDCDANVSGSMSVQGPKGVFCVSCDENDAFCDAIINTLN